MNDYRFWIIYENPVGYVGREGKRYICPGLARRFTEWADVTEESAKYESVAIFQIDGNRKSGREACVDKTHLIQTGI